MHLLHFSFKVIGIALTFIIIVCEKDFAQNSAFAYSGDIIKLDSFGKADNGFPFDRTFFLEREKINTENITSIELYRVRYKNGHRELFPDHGSKTMFTPDYIFKNSDIIKEKNKLTLIVPPLKPNKDFDILVLRGVSGENYNTVLKLNRILIKGPLLFGTNSEGQPSIIADENMKLLYRNLKAAANNNVTDTFREVLPINLNQFYRTVTTPTIKFYKNATTDSKLKTTSYLSFHDIQAVNSGLNRISKPFKDIYLVEQIEAEKKIDKILYGYIPADFTLLSEEQDPFSLSDRINNLASSIHLFDSLYATLNELIITDSLTYSTIRENILYILKAANYNKKYLQNNLNDINDIIEDNAKEAVWLLGDTQSKDLQTKGANIFTLDVGIANIWARGLDNNSEYIPRLYYGVNIYFRPVDKNIKRKYIPGKNEKNNKEDFDIISRRTILQNLSLTAGFTIGSLDNNNFDNFFGGTSLLLGPSYRINRSFRLSTGVCFLKRSQINPLLSEKKFTSGYYLSTSLDFDLLGTLSKVTSLLLK